MKIAIVFHDNDFSNTFRNVLDTLLRAYRHYGSLPKDRGELLQIINQLSLGHYLAFQNQFKYTNGQSTLEHLERIKKYLTLDKKHLLIDDEVIKYVNTTIDNNSATYILDTDYDYPNSNPIWSL
jgi:hypothetical protein